jgi:hypothetical protein
MSDSLSGSVDRKLADNTNTARTAIQADHSDDIAVKDQQQWKVPLGTVIGVVLVIDAKPPAGLKQHGPPNSVVRGPVFLRLDCPQLVLSWIGYVSAIQAHNLPSASLASESDFPNHFESDLLKGP